MRIVEDFISLFFPNYCLGCKRSLYKGERLVCAHCMADVAKTSTHLEAENFVKRKFDGKIHIENAWSYFYYQKSGIAQNLLYNLKYNNMPEVGVEIGKRYAVVIQKAIEQSGIDFIVPVPLHFKKLKKRGYNQSEQFAKGLGEILEIEVVNGLERKVITETQTSKSRMKRWENVSSIFSLKNDIIKNKHILLVDDVITTGATIESCAHVLIQNSCNVSIASIASLK